MYPSASDVQGEASSTGFDQIVVFSYAAVHASLPSGADAHTVLSAWQTQMQQLAAATGVPEGLIEGYVQQYGVVPSTAAQITSWAHGENFLDSAGNLQQAPPPGHNYPGNAQASASTATPPPAQTSLSFLGGTVNIGGMQVSPLVLAGAAVGAFLLFGSGGRRR